MKNNIPYQSEGYESLHRLMTFLARFEWFRELDFWLCRTPLMDVRMWWHGLWVRPDPKHPSNVFDRQIEAWYKESHILTWPIGHPAPYLIAFVARWRAHKNRFGKHEPELWPKNPPPIPAGAIYQPVSQIFSWSSS